MLRHTGQKRTYVHNIKLTALLSLTAGSVKAAGYLSFFYLYHERDRARGPFLRRNLRLVIPMPPG